MPPRIPTVRLAPAWLLAAMLGETGRKRVAEDFGWKRQSAGLVEAVMKMEPATPKKP